MDSPTSLLPHLSCIVVFLIHRGSYTSGRPDFPLYRGFPDTEVLTRADEPDHLPTPRQLLVVRASPSMELNVASCLAEGQLTIEQILIDEARHLCESSPISNVVKHPTASKSSLTEKAKMGVGSAHCVIRRWPLHTTPSEWGRRNENLLLRQIITLDIWTRLGSSFNSIKRRVESTRLESMRANDDGNEEEY